ncbi:MAG: hypothetical protein JXR70_05810 [Spirochaetales bacterium]|nr:hypothetical protein [Spirochaetales bacterium]
MALKPTWEKILEYASSPLHGTLSRKQRKGVKLQINGGDVFENAQIFLGEDFVRLTEIKDDETINIYFDWEKLESIKTLSQTE